MRLEKLVLMNAKLSPMACIRMKAQKTANPTLSASAVNSPSIDALQRAFSMLSSRPAYPTLSTIAQNQRDSRNCAKAKLTAFTLIRGLGAAALWNAHEAFHFWSMNVRKGRTLTQCGRSAQLPRAFNALMKLTRRNARASPRVSTKTDRLTHPVGATITATTAERHRLAVKPANFSTAKRVSTSESTRVRTSMPTRATRKKTDTTKTTFWTAALISTARRTENILFSAKTVRPSTVANVCQSDMADLARRSLIAWESRTATTRIWSRDVPNIITASRATKFRWVMRWLTTCWG